MKILYRIIIAVSLLVVVSGCENVFDFIKDKADPDITEINVGMSAGQVQKLIGPPQDIKEGEGVETGKETWTYQDGIIHFKYFRVVQVILNEENTLESIQYGKPKVEEEEEEILPAGDLSEKDRIDLEMVRAKIKKDAHENTSAPVSPKRLEGSPPSGLWEEK